MTVRTPDDVVAALWDGLVSRPYRMGASEHHPMVDGTVRAVGVLLVPLGFLLFVTLLVFVVSVFAVIYDVIELATRPIRTPRRPR